MSDEKIENSNLNLDEAAPDEPTNSDSTPDNSPKTTPVKVTAVKTTSLFSGLISLVSVVTFLGLGALGYLAYIELQQVTGRISYLEQQEKNSQSQVLTITSELNQNLQGFQNQLKQAVAEQNKASSLKIESIAKQLSVTQRQIQSVNGRHQSDWLLAEADYLVRIASNRLLLERDFTTALSLLLSADERILLMDDPSLQPSREALARDIAVLRAIQKEDIAGIANRISALMPQLKNLTIMSFQLPEETAEDDSQALVTEGDWLESLKNTFKELSVKWFEVRDHGRPVKPLMSIEQESVIRTNIALLLQNAQYATLRQHADLYDQSLTQLKEWLVEYFDLLAPAVSGFITEIDSLKSQSIRRDLPESLESRLLISRQIEKRLAAPSQDVIKESPSISKQKNPQGEQQ
ncbi:MAG: uroporphyrin-3 C-methyltransferase [Enterobacterales bacterium]|jgi:uroporphyrin-3 C-methyltransferase